MGLSVTSRVTFSYTSDDFEPSEEFKSSWITSIVTVGLEGFLAMTGCYGPWATWRSDEFVALALFCFLSSATYFINVILCLISIFSRVWSDFSYCFITPRNCVYSTSYRLSLSVAPSSRLNYVTFGDGTRALLFFVEAVPLGDILRSSWSCFCAITSCKFIESCMLIWRTIGYAYSLPEDGVLLSPCWWARRGLSELSSSSLRALSFVRNSTAFSFDFYGVLSL